MSWDARWILRASSLDVESFEHALNVVLEGAGLSSLEGRSSRESSRRVLFDLELPMAFVNRLRTGPSDPQVERACTGRIEVRLREEEEPHAASFEVSVESVDAVYAQGVGRDDDATVEPLTARPILTGVAMRGTVMHAVSLDEGALRRDGGAWVLEPCEAPMPRLLSLYAARSGDLWAVGEAGAILARGDDGVWRPRAEPTRATMTSICARGTQLWACGHADGEGIVLRFHHDRWELVETPAFGRAVGILASLDGVWLVGTEVALMRESGGRFVEVPTPKRTRMMATGADEGNIWLATEGVAISFDGGCFRETETAIDEPRAIVVRRDEALLAGDGGVAHFRGGEWAAVEECAPRAYLAASHGVAGETLIAANDGTVTTLMPKGPFVEILVSSEAAANREAWGAITALAGALARRIGAGPVA